MNKQQIIDAAMQIALAGTDGHTSPVIDADMTAEDLLPLALRHAYGQLVHSGSLSLQDVIREHEIALDVNGEGDLPDGVLTEYLEQSSLPDFPYSSYMRTFPDYNRERFDQIAPMCYYTVNNGRFYTSCDDGGSGSGSESEEDTILLHAPSIPALPDSASTDIVMPQRALDAVIATLAAAIRGELKLVQ